MEDHRFQTDDTQILKGKCAELHQITQSHQKRQKDMEGTANTLAKALGDVLKAVDFQTQWRNAFLTMHREALIAVDTMPKVLDNETEQLRQSFQSLAGEESMRWPPLRKDSSGEVKKELAWNRRRKTTMGQKCTVCGWTLKAGMITHRPPLIA